MGENYYWWKDRTAEYLDADLNKRWIIKNPYLDYDDPRDGSKLVSKFESIIYDIIFEFFGSGIKIMDNDFGNTTRISKKLIFENTGEFMFLTYGIIEKTIIGSDNFFLDLGLRDITEITKDEIMKIQKVILVWIINHIV